MKNRHCRHVHYLHYLCYRVVKLYKLFLYSFFELQRCVVLTRMMLPQIIRLMFLVKVPTKSTKVGRAFGGPVRTRHWGLGKYFYVSITQILASSSIMLSGLLITFKSHLKFLMWSSTFDKDIDNDKAML